MALLTDEALALAGSEYCREIIKMILDRYISKSSSHIRIISSTSGFELGLNIKFFLNYNLIKDRRRIAFCSFQTFWCLQFIVLIGKPTY